MVAVTAAWNKPLPSRILLFALFFCYERKIGGHGLMASGKVRCPAALDFPETDSSVPVNASYMPVECPFGSDMDVKTIPSGDFKEHSSRDPFPVQEFLFLFIEQQLMLLFPRSRSSASFSSRSLRFCSASFCMPHGLAARVRCRVRGH